MQAYDVLMIVVLATATILGAWKGMAWQLASLSALVISYLVALRFSTPLAPLFGDQHPWNRFVAMLVLYVGTSLVIWLLFRVVAGFIDRLKLKEFDRQLGAVFGLAKGALLCLAITVFAVALLPPERSQTVLGTRSGYVIAQALDRAPAVMPEELKELIGPYLDRVERRLDVEQPAPLMFEEGDWRATQ